MINLARWITGTNNTSGVVKEAGFLNTGGSNSTDRSVTLRTGSYVTAVNSRALDIDDFQISFQKSPVRLSLVVISQ